MDDARYGCTLPSLPRVPRGSYTSEPYVRPVTSMRFCVVSKPSTSASMPMISLPPGFGSAVADDEPVVVPVLEDDFLLLPHAVMTMATAMTTAARRRPKRAG